MSYESTEAEHVGYACAALSVLILAIRIVISGWRREPFDLGFFLVVMSMLVIIGRIVANNYYLQFGTANDVLHNGIVPSSDDEYRLKVGSILVLLARVLLTAGLWLQVCLLLLFYSRITSGITWANRLTKITWATLGITFVAIVLATFLECRPIELYWQVDPDPGTCVRAYVQLLLLGVSNIVIDLLVLFIAYPLICLRKRSWSEYISLYTLFALGTFCIVVTIIRVVLIFNENSSQTTRSLWASVQMFVSCFVANAPTIYGSLRVARRKRSGHRSAADYASGEPLSRPSRFEGESWIKMDEELASKSTAPGARDSLVSPPPPAVISHDDDIIPASRSRSSSLIFDAR
ncbi:uncharacterized protein GGS22DRAFT_160655 [Annulohypoxylon maeteangense]|uniref:uncharacterized protein n=1 Tax=Annulohypoxylon maeteangense TaxID=1927788 RepID=UPI0020075481|nr:uncharacterized protein GGS22DRAFT_160655 [Annulohypoxylon maeteangense]KAI0886359.1 hypothetical protein GGS22DRAFT_160655 [Annulohypoxylon maeteangense]